MKKKLLITSCDDPLLWYYSHVGDSVPYTGQEDTIYWSRDNGGFTNMVKKEHAEVITPSTHPQHFE